ncbi:MAG: hypothetical protein J6Q13_01100 [Clostridia bacterium]|nr:hypothetical protein [Clostridia bacterium]
MSDKEKKPTIRWLEKLKNIKHIEIYVAVIFIVIILLIFLSNNKTKESSAKVLTNDMSVTAYIERMEQNLEESLSSISGVSDVKVMITLNLDKMAVENSQITMTTFPEIKGVLVTAKGVNNTTNKLKVLHAIEAVIDVKNGNIEILSSE